MLESSINITKKLSRKDRKKYGIYFTPTKLVNYIIDLLPFVPKKILEPSSGSGEFIYALKSKFPKANIVAIEFNKTIIKEIDYDVLNLDFLEYCPNNKFDLIIGNPPYYTVSKSKAKNYNKYFTGRPNIYILFIIHSLFLLKKGGFIAFVLPKNFTTCMYYIKLREYINSHFTIYKLESHDANFIDTKQAIIIFIIEKRQGDNSKYVLFPNVIFTEHKEEIENLLHNSTTLKSLGANIYVGPIVWNQNKHLLTDEKYTLLIYSSDIKKNKLFIQSYKNKEKKNYIKKKGSSKPLIVVNRGYGNNYKFNYCLLDPHCDFLVENHLICIEYDDPYLILQSFNDKRTHEFIKLYFANNAINCNELMNILPIYIE